MSQFIPEYRLPTPPRLDPDTYHKLLALDHEIVRIPRHLINIDWQRLSSHSIHLGFDIKCQQNPVHILQAISPKLSQFP